MTTFQFSIWDARTWWRGSVAMMRSSFNSLFEMQAHIDTAPRWVARSAFNSLFEMPVAETAPAAEPQHAAVFQFSIWDADINHRGPARGRGGAFNSLFEMRAKKNAEAMNGASLSILYLRCGSFLWFHFRICDAMYFQFSIWDASSSRSSATPSSTSSFNSLFEMLTLGARMPIGWLKLSILYLRCR